jgi:hypothetical protein
MEKDPLGKDQHEPGAKLDAGKSFAGLIALFGQALLEVAKISTYGAKKYTRGGWQHVPDGVERYNDAFWRHLLEQGGDLDKLDKDSGLLLQAQVVWNALATLELYIRAKHAPKIFEIKNATVEVGGQKLKATDIKVEVPRQEKTEQYTVELKAREPK